MNQCPCCGAGLRLGVWMPRKKRDLLDKLRLRDSVPWQELGTNLNIVKAHVYQINCLLEETNYAIRGRGGYKLVKVR